MIHDPGFLPDLLPILSALTWIRLRFVLRARAAGKLPVFIGSALRGAIGPRLEILLGDKTHRSSEPAMAIDTRLLPDREIGENGRLPWGLLLIGDFRTQLEEIVYLLGQDLQLGEARIPFSVESIALQPSILFSPQEQAMEIVPRLERGDRFVLRQRWIEPPDEAEIRLLTPLRLRHKGQLLTAFEPEIFFRRLWDRLMRYAQSSEKREKGRCLRSPHFENLTLRAGGKKWFDLESLSYSQNKAHPMSGLIGQARFGPMTPELWALLQMGEVFHVGEKTAYGLGRYRIAKR